MRTVNIDLKKRTLADVANPPSWEGSDMEIINLTGEDYLHDIIDTSEVEKNIFGVKMLAHRFPNSLNHLRYIPDEKKIVIKSKYQLEFRFDHLFFLFIAVVSFLTNMDKIWTMIYISIIVFLFLTMLLYFVLRSDAKTIERELILRINQALG